MPLVSISTCLTRFSAETGSMREYILNLKALEICLASHEELYGQALTLIEELRR